MVFTDDKMRPNHSLSISGLVETFATITPRTLRLFGSSGQPLKATATIIPQDKYPFKILQAKAKKGDSIRYKLEDIKQSEKSGYLLVVENTKKVSGRYFDTIQLKTTSNIQPEIQIRVYGNITDKVKQPIGPDRSEHKAGKDQSNPVKGKYERD